METHTDSTFQLNELIFVLLLVMGEYYRIVSPISEYNLVLKQGRVQRRALLTQEILCFTLEPKLWARYIPNEYSYLLLLSALVEM